jgi:CheY-like chemotaxis protein
VSDTGAGMTPDVLARAFEPFFTTKGVGKGSGLGLSMVYGFLRQSGGHAKIYSEAGHGTTVRLYLPRAASAATVEVSHAEPPEVGGHEHVLVVEDDPLVREHAVTLLRGLGYRVSDAADGAAALKVLAGPESVDLLFTDIVMPGGMNGRQLADAARSLRPHLRVLYTSGYTENAIVHHGRLDPGVQLLAKPYRRRQLAQKVRAVLDGPELGAGET